MPTVTPRGGSSDSLWSRFTSGASALSKSISTNIANAYAVVKGAVMPKQHEIKSVFDASIKALDQSKRESVGESRKVILHEEEANIDTQLSTPPEPAKKTRRFFLNTIFKKGETPDIAKTTEEDIAFTKISKTSEAAYNAVQKMQRDKNTNKAVLENLSQLAEKTSKDYDKIAEPLKEHIMSKSQYISEGNSLLDPRRQLTEDERDYLQTIYSQLYSDYQGLLEQERNQEPPELGKLTDLDIARAKLKLELLMINDKI